MTSELTLHLRLVVSGYTSGASSNGDIRSLDASREGYLLLIKTLIVP